MHKMGTLPDGPPSHVIPDIEDEESTQQDSLSSVAHRQPPSRPRMTSNVSRQGGTAAVRPPRRASTPAPDEDSSSDIVTHQVRGLTHRNDEPEDTNETRLPDGEDGPSLVTSTTPDAAALRPSRGSGVLIILAVLALLVLGGGTAVALGLDGGLISGLWTSKPRDEKPTEPPKTSAETPANGAAPAPPPAPAAAPPTPATEPVATATPSPTEPAPAAGAGTAAPTGAEAVALKTAAALDNPESAKEPAALEPKPEPVAAAAPVEEPQPPSKRTRQTTKRFKREQRPAEDNPPSDWAPVDEKPEAAQAAAPSGEPGVLTIVTAPYAKVYLGKRYLGDTPLFKLTLPSGKHMLRLVDPEGQNLRLPVEIKAGETTKVNLELSTLARE
jgi:hypothetical protein